MKKVKLTISAQGSIILKDVNVIEVGVAISRPWNEDDVASAFAHLRETKNLDDHLDVIEGYIEQLKLQIWEMGQQVAEDDLNDFIDDFDLNYEREL